MLEGMKRTRVYVVNKEEGIRRVQCARGIVGS